MNLAIPKPGTGGLYPYEGTLTRKQYMARAKQCPCAICGATPVDLHHPRSGPYAAGKRADHYDVICLCERCHTGGFQHCRDPLFPAYHKEKRKWEDLHGPDHTYIPQTRKAVAEMNFLSDQSGAVTADWVLLTVAIVAIVVGAAVISP